MQWFSNAGGNWGAAGACGIGRPALPASAAHRMTLAEIASERDGERLTLVMGGPRSGTTWLAKIFDSHPDVLYRHEPDTVLRDWSFPPVCPPEEIDRHLTAARQYLCRLVETRSLKSAGSLPLFAKSYQTQAARQSRGALIWGLRAIERLPLLGDVTGRRSVPDLIGDDPGGRLRLVIKSVSASGRVGLFAEALRRCRIVFILRNPYGQVASMLRGTELGKFAGTAAPVDEVLATGVARQYGLTARRLAQMSLAERLAWHWAALNETALAALRDVPRARIIRYRDLVTDPAGCARSLFDFAGLAWHPQAEQFVAASSSYAGTERYFQIFRNGAAPAEKWRRELSPGAIAAIGRVLRQTSLRSFWPELEDMAGR